jgi:L-rhamnose mutarotase
MKPNNQTTSYHSIHNSIVDESMRLLESNAVSSNSIVSNEEQDKLYRELLYG